MVDALLRQMRQRQANLPILLTLIPHVARSLCFFALQEDVETAQARDLIARYRMAAPAQASGSASPVAVRVFGRMMLSLHGTVAASGGKAQRRPMLLLKALLAAIPAGRTQQALAAQLWPDSDDARTALNVTVHRLRKLLGRDDAVVVAAGTIALDGSVIWSDVGALEDVCKRIEAGNDAPAEEVRRCTADLLDLYRGPFCDGDEESWLLPARERWRNRFLGAVESLGRRLEALGEWRDARRLYVRALDAEPLSETCYRGLMRCACAEGDSAAAFSAYRRCRDTLSIVLGQSPSADTEKLTVSLGLRGASADGLARA